MKIIQTELFETAEYVNLCVTPGVVKIEGASTCNNTFEHKVYLLLTHQNFT